MVVQLLRLRLSSRLSIVLLAGDKRIKVGEHDMMVSLGLKVHLCKLIVEHLEEGKDLPKA